MREATKVDLAELKSDLVARIADVKAGLEIKIADVKAGLEIKIAETKADIIKGVIGVGFAQPAMILAALKAHL